VGLGGQSGGLGVAEADAEQGLDVLLVLQCQATQALLVGRHAHSPSAAAPGDLPLSPGRR